MCVEYVSNGEATQGYSPGTLSYIDYRDRIDKSTAILSGSSQKRILTNISVQRVKLQNNLQQSF